MTNELPWISPKPEHFSLEALAQLAGRVRRCTHVGVAMSPETFAELAKLCTVPDPSCVVATYRGLEVVQIEGVPLGKGVALTQRELDALRHLSASARILYASERLWLV
jgi:hypothetical protein